MIINTNRIWIVKYMIKYFKHLLFMSSYYNILVEVWKLNIVFKFYP